MIYHLLTVVRDFVNYFKLSFWQTTSLIAKFYDVVKQLKLTRQNLTKDHQNNGKKRKNNSTIFNLTRTKQ